MRKKPIKPKIKIKTIRKKKGNSKPKKKKGPSYG
jgi:hypothetical protein